MKALFFSVQQGILPHSIPEGTVAKSLIERGHEVFYLTCNSVLSDFCVTMSAHGLTVDSSNDRKRAICNTCTKNRDWIIGELGIKNFFIEDFMIDSDTSRINSILNELTKENIVDFEIDAIPLGRYAAYEFVINHKLSSLNQLDNKLFSEYKIHFKNALTVVFAAKNFLKIYKPDTVITYNNFYSANHAFTSVCDLLNIDHYTIHAGHNLKNRLNTLYLTSKYTPYILLAHSGEWKNARNIPNTRRRIETVESHFLELFKGQNVFVYSAPIKRGDKKNLRSFFNISENQKVVLLVLTSGDERFAASLIDVMPHLAVDKTYGTQIEWFKAMVEYFSGRNDVAVIVRPHPREFPNKRESVLSKQAEILIELFQGLPMNFVVNWPTDNISIYEIASIVDLCLPSTSSTGFEMAALGAPVITYSPHDIFAYPAEDLTVSSINKDDYLFRVEEGLTMSWSIEFSRLAFRWAAFKYCDFDIDLTDILEFREGVNRSISFRMEQKIERLFRNGLEKNELEMNRIRVPKEFVSICSVLENKNLFHLKEFDSSISDLEETEYLRKTLKKIHKILRIKKIDF